MNVKPTKTNEGNKMPIRRQGLAALVRINGVDAYTCWDSGSELDAISPKFIRAVGIPPNPKEEALRIQLGTKGSSSRTSYEVKPTLNIGNTKLEHPIDVVNLDRWDLLLGSPFCNQYRAVLDCGMRTIRFSDTVVKTLSLDEEAAIRRSNPAVHLQAISQ